jgi:hypothetical protein
MGFAVRFVGVFLVFAGIFILFLAWAFTSLADPGLPPDQRWNERTSLFFHSDALPFGLGAIALGIWFFLEGMRKPKADPRNSSTNNGRTEMRPKPTSSDPDFS